LRSKERRVRAALERMYRISGQLAGFFLVAIAALSLAQIGGRLLGFAAHSFDEFAGYCMAASSFLGLAFTLRANEHIRMALVLHRARGRVRRALELACLTVGIALTGFFGWYAADMVWFSFITHDLSQGLVPVPLWIPQTGMALGLTILLVALLDDLVAALLGAPPSYDRRQGAAHGFEN
jgi:TRAP-type C4-dicarboxylate transport system permease small subunit